jgi:hypothetical protein
MKTDFLEVHLSELQKIAKVSAARASEDPDDFWKAATAENQAQAVRDVARELELARAEESGELLDLRFLGPKADGALPLDIFLKIAEPLSKAWKAAAFRLRHGVADGRIGTEISDSLNLKLAGIAPGSTHIFLTGSMAEDMTGESLLRSTLQQTFRLLGSRNDEFYDAVDAIGGRAALSFKEAMKAISAAELSVEFSWRDEGHVHKWKGTSDELIRINTLLAAASESESYEETLSGVVSGLFENGRLDLRTATGKVKIRFSIDQTPAVQHLTIATHATLRVLTTRYTDPITHREVFKRQLIDRDTRQLIS